VNAGYCSHDTGLGARHPALIECYYLHEGMPNEKSFIVLIDERLDRATVRSEKSRFQQCQRRPTAIFQTLQQFPEAIGNSVVVRRPTAGLLKERVAAHR
jgi:hypothetical protein